MGRAERRKEERNINHAKSTGADACSILTFVEDGRMFYKLLDHRDRYPESTPDLMLTILPFCALAAHDSVRFVKKYFDHDFELDSAVVNRLRNASKSLSAKGSTVEDYTFMTNSVTRGLSSSTKKATGLFGPLINSLTPDMGICTHGDRPVCTTFITARYISQAYGGALDPVWSEECEKQLGFDLGVAASAAFYTVKLLTPELHTLTAKEFETCHVDCHYSDMFLPLKKQGIDNAACFFMLAEFLVQLNAVFALSENEMFDDVLRMKYGTAVLLALDGSISRFANCVMPKPSEYGFTADGALVLSTLVPKEVRKRVRASKDLRNAFVHYDFLDF